MARVKQKSKSSTVHSSHSAAEATSAKSVQTAVLTPPSLQLKNKEKEAIEEDKKSVAIESKSTDGSGIVPPPTSGSNQSAAMPAVTPSFVQKSASVQLKEGEKKEEKTESGSLEHASLQFKTAEELKEEEIEADKADDAIVAVTEATPLNIEGFLVEGQPKRGQKLLQKGYPTDEPKRALFKQYPHLLTRFLAKIDPFSGEEIFVKEQKLSVLSAKDAFQIIDNWYPNTTVESRGITFSIEEKKVEFYAKHIDLRKKMSKELDPFTGVSIKETVESLKKEIGGKEYTADSTRNNEFHRIHLISPTVEEKLDFYTQHNDLLEVVKSKFDPYTGISLKTMKALTDKDDPNEDEATKVYMMLAKLPLEMRQAFFQASSFAGSLEKDTEKQAHFKKNNEKAYKELPAEWYAAIAPWKWDAPFADRRTVDYGGAMSSALPYELIEQKGFGFDRGIDSSRKAATVKETDEKSSEPSDAQKLIKEIAEDASWKDTEESRNRLDLLLSIVSNASYQNLIDKVIAVINTHHSDKLTEKEAKELGLPTPQNGLSLEQLNILHKNGFVHSDIRTIYHAPREATEERIGIGTYGWRELTDSDTNIIGEDRATIDLTEYQKTSHGHVSGMRFGKESSIADSEYNNEWLDGKVKGLGKQTGLDENLKKHKGYDRTGKIFASYTDDDRREMNILASVLPIENMNYFSEGSVIKSAEGALKGLHLNIKWDKDASEKDNTAHINFSLGEMVMNDLRMISPRSTLGIGHIGMKGINISLTQSMGKMESYFLGGFKNEKMMVTLLSEVLPGFMKLLPYSVMSMIEEIKGMRSHEYKDKLQQAMQTSFNSLDAILSFTGLEVSNMYDTVAGMLDGVKIEKTDANGQPVNQTITIQQDVLWVTTACNELVHRMKALDGLIKTESDKTEGKDAQQISVWELEKTTLQSDLDYLAGNNTVTNYNKDSALIENEEGSKEERYAARLRVYKYKGKYQSFKTEITLQGIQLKGGDYVRKMFTDIMVGMGMESPELKGVENINIEQFKSTFTASGSGTKGVRDDQDLKITDITIPEIKAKRLLRRADTMLIDGKEPVFKNVKISASVNLSDYMLDKDPKKTYTWKLDKLSVGQATFMGLRISMGKDKPDSPHFNNIIDLTEGQQADLYNLELKDYNPDDRNIKLTIGDIVAKGHYESGDKGKNVGFDIDTKKEKHKNPALDIDYNATDETLVTKLDIPMVMLPTMMIDSPTFGLTTGNNAVKLSNISADIRVLFEKRKDKKNPKSDQIRPMTVEVNSFHLGKIEAQGIRAVLKEEIKEAAPRVGKPDPQKFQIIEIPNDKVISLENLDIQGLGVKIGDETKKAEDGKVEPHTTLFDLNGEGKTSVGTGAGDFTGLTYSDNKGKQQLLSVLLSKGAFNGIDLEKMRVDKEGRDYELKEFFKFFGSESLSGLDMRADVTKGKTTASVAIKGKKTPITVKENGEFIDIRLPLEYINIPKLHVESGDDVIDLPALKGKMSQFKDVDAKLRLKQEDNGNKIYIDEVDVKTFEAYGLKYSNKKDGMEVKFSEENSFFISNFKMKDFLLNMPSKGGTTFGAANQKGGTVTTDAIIADADRIKMALENGGNMEASAGAKFMASSFSFSMFKDKSMAMELGGVNVGIPKMTVTTIDEKGEKSQMNIDMKDPEQAAYLLKADTVGLSLNPYTYTATEGKDKGKDVTGYKSHFWVKNPKLNGLSLTIPDLKRPGEYLNIQTDLALNGQINGGVGDYDSILEGYDDKANAFVLHSNAESTYKATLSNLVITSHSTDKPKEKTDFGKEISTKQTDLAKQESNLSKAAAGSVDRAQIDGKIRKLKADIEDLKRQQSNSLYTQERLKVQGQMVALEDEIAAEYKIYQDNFDMYMSLSIGRETMTVSDVEQECLDKMTKAQDAIKAKKAIYQELVKKAELAAENEFRTSEASKYLDLTDGMADADVKIRVLGGEVSLKMESLYNNKNVKESFVVIDNDFTDKIQSLLQRYVYSTRTKSFWTNPHIIGAAKDIITSGSPTTDAMLNLIAEGKGDIAVGYIIKKLVKVNKGHLKNGMYGLTIDMQDMHWYLDADDAIEIPLCSAHGSKVYGSSGSGDKINLKDLVQHMGYMKSAAPNKSTLAESDTLKFGEAIAKARATEKMAKGSEDSYGFNTFAQEIDDAGLGDLKDKFMKFFMGYFLKNILPAEVASSFKGFDLGLKVKQELLDKYLRQTESGSITFLNAKDSPGVFDLNFSLDAIDFNTSKPDNVRVKTAAATLGAGESGKSLKVPPFIYTNNSNTLKAGIGGISMPSVKFGVDNLSGNTTVSIPGDVELGNFAVAVKKDFPAEKKKK